jgi:hypothetical protein
MHLEVKFFFWELSSLKCLNIEAWSVPGWQQYLSTLKTGRGRGVNSSRSESDKGGLELQPTQLAWSTLTTWTNDLLKTSVKGLSAVNIDSK